MGFSALDVITYSATVTGDCIAVLRDPNRTVWAKLRAIFTIVNNFMNKEAFFYMDLIICAAFSIYNATVTKPMKAFVFYIDGALVINLVLLWYFCYCRYSNGKDVTTLRRSIQLLSHSFQVSLVGLLVLCHISNIFCYEHSLNVAATHKSDELFIKHR
jgi:CDP-diglyceride synthetase